MIGIDITRISRFKNMRNLPKFIDRYHVDGVDAVAAAKTWACLEAIYKAEGGGVLFKNIKISFPKNSAPTATELVPSLKYHYQLSLSHEDDLLVAVALGSPK